VTAPTYTRWQQLYGGKKATEAKRLKELEQENTPGSIRSSLKNPSTSAKMVQPPI
jgi:hypothetical protein